MMLSMEALYRGIEDIENTYVNRRFSLNDKQLNQWYKLLKVLSDAAYLGAIDEWCSTHDTLPSPSNILEIANRLRPSDNSVNIVKNAERCVHCGDTGFIRFYKTSEKIGRRYEYIACCVCEMGEQAKAQYPFPQASRDKLSMMTTIPESKPKEHVKVERLVEQFNMI